MKKIVYVSIPMKEHLGKQLYKYENGTVAQNEACFVASVALENYIHANDDIKVVMIKKQSDSGFCDKHAETLQNEINALNNSIGAKVQYVSIETPFVENKQSHEQLLTQLVDELEEDAEIVGDITFSTKSMPILIFSTLNFAEKFFDCKIKKIVYGKVDFVNNKPTNPEICDVTPLYYINSITNTMDANSGEDAKALLKKIINK